jgi:hypothetical protein
MVQFMAAAGLNVEGKREIQKARFREPLAMHTQRLASHIGQPCRIVLPATAGATWYVEPAGAPVKVNLEQSGRMGSDGQQTFVLVGELPGAHELRFVLKRAWETRVRSSHRVVLHVQNTGRRTRAH